MKDVYTLTKISSIASFFELPTLRVLQTLSCLGTKTIKTSEEGENGVFLGCGEHLTSDILGKIGGWGVDMN